MAIKTTGVWGIDLGQCALKAVRIENVDGQIVATAFDYVEHPKMLNQPDAEPDQLIREALQKFLSRNILRGDIVAISVPSQSGLARFVKLPPVEEKKIADIVRFEAKQQIPFSLDEVVWDYQKIGAGLVTDGFAIDTEIGLFAMKRDKVSSYLEHFRGVNVEVHIVQMAPLALCNYVGYDLLGKGAPGSNGEAEESSGKKRCIVALDIGTDSSNMVITDGQRIIWQRPIPLGGNQFTRALTKDPFKLTFAKAEHLKRNATKSGPELKKILTALKPVLNDFVSEVQRSLGYFTNTHRDAQVEYMVGLGNAFRLPGFQRFLSEKLQIDVRKLAKLERLTGDSVVQAPVFTENVLTFSVAYGLALQGLALARLQTNLLPPEIRTARLIKAKKPWAVAAAAILLLGAAGMMLGGGKTGNEYNLESPELKAAMAKADGLLSERKKNNTAFENKKAEVDDVEDELKAFTGTRQEDWMVLEKYINDSIPRPELQLDKNGNLEKVVSISPVFAEAKKRYWDANPGAAQAQLEYLTAQAEGKVLKDVAKEFWERRYREHQAQLSIGGRRPDEKTLQDAMRPKDHLEANLFLLSIEGVKPRYTRDLGGAWAKALKNQLTCPDAVGAAWLNGAEPQIGEPGWVVAIRGYTFHFDRTRFVIATLGNNLAATCGIKQQFLDKPEPESVKASAGSGPGSKGKPPARGASSSSADAVPHHPVIGKVNQLMLYYTSEKDPDNTPDLEDVFGDLIPDAATQTKSSSANSAKKSSNKRRRKASKGAPTLIKKKKMVASDTGPTASSPGAFWPGDLGSTYDLRRTPETGVDETEFIFLLFWKGPGPEDLGVPSGAPLPVAPPTPAGSSQSK